MEMNLTILLGVILIALAVQFVVEAIKGLITAVFKYKGTEDTTGGLLAPFLAMIWAVGLCILTGSDLFLAFGFPLAFPYVGAITTGIIASLGANKVYDLIISFKEYKELLAKERVDAIEEETYS